MLGTAINSSGIDESSDFEAGMLLCANEQKFMVLT